MTNAEILAAARGLIDDAEAAFCPAAELAMHLEEVARDFAKRTRILRTRKIVTLTTSGELVLPEDCEEILKVVDSDSDEIPSLTHAEMVARYGDDWEDQSGDPEFYTRDITGVEVIRFSHKPTADTPLTLTYIQGHVPNNNIVIPSRYHLTLVWGTAAKAIAKSNNPADESMKAQFATAYEAGLREAAKDAAKNFSSRPRTIPYRHF